MTPRSTTPRRPRARRPRKTAIVWLELDRAESDTLLDALRGKGHPALIAIRKALAEALDRSDR